MPLNWTATGVCGTLSTVNVTVPVMMLVPLRTPPGGIALTVAVNVTGSPNTDVGGLPGFEEVTAMLVAASLTS